MVKVKEINWLSEEAREAEVNLSDGCFQMICFSHPFEYNLGDTVPMPLYALNTENIYRLNGIKEFSVERVTSYEYRLSACVIDKHQNHIKIGDFIIKLDSPLPGDVEFGDYVFCICHRLDILTLM